MKFDLSVAEEAAQALQHLVMLTAGQKLVEVKEVRKTRSLQQNAYLHLLLSAFGANFGYSLEEAKQLYKQLNEDIYHYDREVRGKTHHFTRSSADVTTEEMTRSIERLREWSAKAGYPLPTATDQGWLREIEREAERNKHYL